MKTKHTPGPWVISGHLTQPYSFQISDKERNTIATVHGREVDYVANACLIASAPDLLEACEAMANPLINRQKAWSLLTNAVAKARGETVKT